jgi:Ni/Fe-hydrogenase 1 B-type cytochrome subunit
MSSGAYRTDHPLPAVVMHWTHLVSMIALGFTGFYIHYPFFVANMAMMRTIHFVFMFIVLINLVVRVYWAFFGKGDTIEKHPRRVGRDYRNFGPQKANKGTFPEIVKYYTFVRKTHPRTAKFNTLQKSTYFFWAILLLAQGYTGFSIYGPFAQVPFFKVVSDGLGGLMVMREIHFFIMWVFILTALIHVYLVFAEDFEQFPLMFFWKERKAAEAH